MSKAKVTLYGIYNYMEKIHEKSPKEPTLFDQLSFPEGIDRDIFIYNTLDRGGEFEVIYADSNVLHEKVLFWSGKWYRTFDRWVKALSVDYSPLYNYDRTEEETRKPNLIDTRISNLKDTRTADMTVTDKPATTRTLNGSRTEEKTVSAYDSSSYQPSEKLTITDNGHTETLTGTDTSKTTGTDTEDHTGSESRTYTGNEIRTMRSYGNIGVTTSQQMLEAELTISEWNLYDHLSDIFIREFCIPVYV